MGTDRFGDPCSPGVLPKELPTPLTGETHSTTIEEQRLRRPTFQQMGPSLAHIRADSLYGVTSHGDHAFFAAFPEYADELRLQVNISQIETNNLGDSEPARVHDLEHRTIATTIWPLRVGYRQQPLNVVEGKHAW
jgi:hypothetical protein